MDIRKKIKDKFPISRIVAISFFTILVYLIWPFILLFGSVIITGASIILGLIFLAGMVGLLFNWEEVTGTDVSIIFAIFVITAALGFGGFHFAYYLDEKNNWGLTAESSKGVSPTEFRWLFDKPKHKIEK